MVVETLTQRRLAALEDRVKQQALEIARLRHSDLAPQQSFHAAELKIESQNGEDGVLLWLFSRIGATDHRFVEFGVEDGRECNTANLSRHWGWSGLLIEADEEGAAAARRYYGHLPVAVERAMVQPDNINDLMGKHDLGGAFDLLSIDIDGNDLWVWQAIKARPRVTVIEYNPSYGPEWSASVPFDPGFSYDEFVHGGTYHGASITALSRIGAAKGYSLVGCESAGANAFFVRDDCLQGLQAMDPADAWRPNPTRRGSIEEQMRLLRSLPWVEID
jgi:hypothetical protein